MEEEFQGGVCGGTWWNPPRNLFSGGGSGGLSSPCSVAQLGGGCDMGNFIGWPNNEVTKGIRSNNIHNYEKNNSGFCDNSIVFPADDIDSTLDIFGFGLSPTSSTTPNWSQQNLLCNDGINGGNYDSIIQDNMNSRLSYGIGPNSPTIMNSNNFSNNSNNTQDGSPPMALTASSNSSGDSSTITSEGVLNTSFPMSSSASYLIQTLFDDPDESQPESQPMSQLIDPNYGVMNSNELILPVQNTPSSSLQLGQNNNLNEEMNLLINGGVLNNQYSTMGALSSIRASLLNSLQSRSRAPSSFNQKSHNCAKLSTKVNNNEEVRDSKRNVNDQPPAKRPRIETPSPLPTFKVRKEKLGDRITALQQLVSPFGKTDTASVLHEAIDYIRFLHDQVSGLSAPYLKNGAVIQHQQGSDTMNDNKELEQDLRSRGLCLVPISSTYPVAQETPVDFWTPTFGGTTFR